MAAIVFLGRRDPGAEFDVQSKIDHAHFCGRDARECHDIRQAAEVANPEDLARDLTEPHAKGHAILVGSMCHDIGGVEVFGRPNGADSVRVNRRVRGAKFKAPSAHRRAHTLCNPVMPGKHVLQTFGQQHVAGLVQTVQQSHSRRIGIGVVRVAFGHVVYVEKRAGQSGGFGGLHRLG